MLSIFVAMFMASCQNSTPAPTDAGPETAVLAPAPVVKSTLKFDPMNIEEARSNVKISVQNMKQLSQDLQAASTSTQGADKAAVEAMTGELTGILEKQQMVQEGLEKADVKKNTKTSDSGTSAPSDVVQDYIQSAASYDQLATEFKARLDQIKAKGN